MSDDLRTQSDGFEEDELAAMLAEAADAATVESLPEHFGDEVDLAEGEAFAGRYRGEDVDPAFDRAVFLLHDEAGAPCFIRSRTVLTREFDEKRPAVGDRLVIKRGQDGEGQKGTFHRYGMATRPYSESPPVSGGALLPDDIPFMRA